jgi:hypothetical protein
MHPKLLNAQIQEKRDHRRPHPTKLETVKGNGNPSMDDEELGKPPLLDPSMEDGAIAEPLLIQPVIRRVVTAAEPPPRPREQVLGAEPPPRLMERTIGAE